MLAFALRTYLYSSRSEETLAVALRPLRRLVDKIGNTFGSLWRPALLICRHLAFTTPVVHRELVPHLMHNLRLHGELLGHELGMMDCLRVIHSRCCGAAGVVVLRVELVAAGLHHLRASNHVHGGLLA